MAYPTCWRRQHGCLCGVLAPSQPQPLEDVQPQKTSIGATAGHTVSAAVGTVPLRTSACSNKIANVLQRGKAAVAGMIQGGCATDWINSFALFRFKMADCGQNTASSIKSTTRRQMQ